MTDNTLTPKQARAAWVAALRSGEYEQAKGALDTDYGYCCLGVACRVAIDHGVAVDVDYDGHQTTYDGHNATLPLVVQTWLGLASDTGRLVDPEPDMRSLIDANDDAGYDFDEIADLIEADRVELAQ